jgi:hypothetical protein
VTSRLQQGLKRTSGAKKEYGDRHDDLVVSDCSTGGVFFGFGIFVSEVSDTGVTQLNMDSEDLARIQKIIYDSIQQVLEVTVGPPPDIIIPKDGPLYFVRRDRWSASARLRIEGWEQQDLGEVGKSWGEEILTKMVDHHDPHVLLHLKQAEGYLEMRLDIYAAIDTGGTIKSAAKRA